MILLCLLQAIKMGILAIYPSLILEFRLIRPNMISSKHLLFLSSRDIKNFSWQLNRLEEPAHIIK